jgi:hypothetical protein
MLRNLPFTCFGKKNFKKKIFKKKVNFAFTKSESQSQRTGYQQKKRKILKIIK